MLSKSTTDNVKNVVKVLNILPGVCAVGGIVGFTVYSIIVSKSNQTYYDFANTNNKSQSQVLEAKKNMVRAKNIWLTLIALVPSFIVSMAVYGFTAMGYKTIDFGIAALNTVVSSGALAATISILTLMPKRTKRIVDGVQLSY